GQFDSPFVRRVAIAMRLYGIGFEHKPWSTFGDADKIAPYNPLRRRPTPAVDDGAAPRESAIILAQPSGVVGLSQAVIPRPGEAHPALFDARYPALKAHSAACEALPPFKEIVQPLAPPKG